MRQKLLYLTTVLFLGLLTLNTLAQTPVKTQTAPVKAYPVPGKKVYYPRKALDTVKNTDFSLNGQYRFMLSRSRSSYGAKLINPARLDAVWKSVSDTLKKGRTELKIAKSKIIEQEKTITGLQNEINGQETSLSTSNAKMNEISFIGIALEKGNYHIIVWSIIALLGIALLIVIIRSSKNIIEAKHRTQLYDEISTEYQAFKTKSNEQQRKLARELQDERNIIEELKGRS